MMMRWYEPWGKEGTMTPISEAVQMPIRVSEGLRLAVQMSAERAGRSREKHIIHILEKYLREEEARMAKARRRRTRGTR
jgi:L-asparaginase II